MKLTLQIRLLPTDEQAVMLKKTFSVFNEACNTISQIAWERHVFKQFNLHKEVYYPIKETYHLSSQLVVRAISKVADAYKLDKKKQRHFREFGAITYDSRVLSYNTDKSICSISLIGGREKNRISKQVVAKAKEEHKGIAIEDLKNIRWGMNSKKRSKTFRRRSNSWNFYQLRSFLEYKCKMNGVQITVIPPVYTSQTCHECGHIGIRNGKHFRCVHCGNVADADVNAALNIATWGYVNTHERWELLSCPIHDDYSTSKAHKSLVCG